MKKYLEFTDEKSQKFWEVTVSGKKLSVRFGKIGTGGRITEKEYASDREAAKEAQNLIQSKLKKGYREPNAENHKKTYLSVHGSKAAELQKMIDSFIAAKSRGDEIRKKLCMFFKNTINPDTPPEWIVIEEPKTVADRLLHFSLPMFFTGTSDDDEYYDKELEHSVLILDEFNSAEWFAGIQAGAKGLKKTRITEKDISNINCYHLGIILTDITWFDSPPDTLEEYHRLMKEAGNAYEGELDSYGDQDVEKTAELPETDLPSGRTGEILAQVKKLTLFRGRNEKKVTELLEEALTLPDSGILLDYVFEVYREQSNNPKFNTVPVLGDFISEHWDRGAGEKIQDLLKTNLNSTNIFLLTDFIESVPKEHKEVRRKYFQLLKDYSTSQDIPENIRRSAATYVNTISRFNPVE